MNTKQLDPIEEMIGKSLERMRPGELARYITIYQREANGIQLVDPPRHIEVSTLKNFQKHYGPDRAAAIVRFLFLQEGGKYEVWGERQFIEHHHFTSGMRRWSNKIDIALQVKANDKPEDDTEFIFATEL